MIFSFDDHHFGMADDNNRYLQERLVARPPGIDRHDWYNFAGEMLRVLGRHKAQWQAEVLEELLQNTSQFREANPVRGLAGSMADELRRQAEGGTS